MQKEFTPNNSECRYKLLTDQIFARIKEGVPSWETPWIEVKTPTNLFTRTPYIGIQGAVLEAIGFPKQLFLTEDELEFIGGSLKPGERPYEIVVRSIRKSSDSQFQPKGIPHTERIINVEQCQNIPPQYLKPFEERDNITFPACESMVAGMPNPPDITHQESAPQYKILYDTIDIPPIIKFRSSTGYYYCLFQCLIHATSHPNRLNRRSVFTTIEPGTKEQFEEALIAAFGAAFLSDEAGIFPATLLDCATYIAGLTSLSMQAKVDVDIEYVLEKATHAAGYVLGK